ncbi:MAG: 4-hydroxy-tetrahydrodipicolinate synthase [Chitinophagaceae bacterium]|jgi:4-hydroxy-tetrahydrodipicolinate synthase|nr:4-hydroxy-tetrahydrodipicolinate synthase [Chitinophagaceae bacterium]MCA6468978.1 4-hydroxy-tetrahydrodipicolinate synthase [Chitinophagaceae bacterium]MCA6476631.1 4-hydroxy-tetrahydrodipicolinate synthase [Chitinophagaceae bacterium]MCA6480050.1 4-hydroxy-tetrahydrodipicolinate synthase [Chitinophagaceae bacterium]
MSNSTLHQLRGTGVAIVTPFDEKEQIDFPALGNIINFLIKGGVEYIVSLGTTGETPVLDKSEKKDILQFTYETVAGRIPVVAGIGGNYTKAVIQELEQLPLDKAAAILSVSPAYNKPSQEGIYLHYRSMAESSPLPILLYNVPGRTGRNMTADTTLRLATLSNIVGIKEASGMMDQCAVILQEKPENFLVISGDDALSLPLLAAGMDGVISVAANAYPAAFSSMVRYCLAGNFDEARIINNRLLPVYDLLFAENNPAGVKAFLHLQGLLKNQLRLPLVPLSQPIFDNVQKCWEALQNN